MPIYEYRCNQCKATISVFQRSISAAVAATCDRCGSADLSRLISRFAVLRSEDAAFDGLADDAAFADVDESDPKSMAAWARRMKSQVGEDLGPEFDEMVSRMESGEMPADDDWGGGEDDAADWE